MSTTTQDPTMAATAPPQFAMMQLITGHWIARSIQVAAALGVADQLADGPLELQRIATAVNADPVSLGRLLRALSTIGVFAQVESSTFANTELSSTLTAGHPNSVGAVARLFGRRWHHRAWTELETAIRTGQCSLDIEYPDGLVALVENDPDEAHAFDDGIDALGRLANSAIVATLAAIVTRHGRASLVSLGGGHSVLPALVIERGLVNCVHLVDRPRVIERWRSRYTSLITDGRLQLTETPLPENILDLSSTITTDIVLLDRVLHDWDDDVAAELLTAARHMLSCTGRVVVIEQLLTPGDPRVAFLDLQMLVHRGGAERTIAQFTTLAARADLVLDAVEPTYSPMSIIVLRPASTNQETSP